MSFSISRSSPGVAGHEQAVRPVRSPERRRRSRREPPRISKRTRTVHLIDGHYLIFRAYHALPAMLSPRGEPIGAVYGYAQSLIKLLKDLRPTHLAVAFDHDPVRSFRTLLYPPYKAQRGEPAADLAAQFAPCMRVTDALGIAALEREGFEADDLIATAAERLHAHATIVIVSDDKDLAQLVRPGVWLRSISGDQVLDRAGVEARFGVAPALLPDFQALVGDPVDNIPGVRGVGPKTASPLLRRLGSLNKILARPERVSQLPFRGADTLAERLASEAPSIRRFLQLTRLRTDAPVRVSLRALRYRGAQAGAQRLFNRLGLARLTSRILKGTHLRAP